MSEQKKEFKVGDDVWSQHWKKVFKGVFRGYDPQTKNGWIKFERGTHLFLDNEFFHTPQELLENIKQQIDGIL